MADYTITFARSARKELEALARPWSAGYFQRSKRWLKSLAQKGCRKLRAEKSLWRLRVGDYRVVYAIVDSKQVVDIVAVRHRSAAYE